MAQQWYVGVYGNTQKTLFALYDRTHQRFDLVTAQSIDHEFLPHGFQDFESILTHSLDTLLSRNGLTAAEITSAGFGLAGDDVKRQHQIIQTIISRTGIQNFVHANEAALMVKTESPAGFGVGAINNYGFSVLAIDKEGNTVQVGGLGDVTGDLEGGYYMASCVWKSIYRQLFICGEETSMTEDVFQYLGIHTKEEFLEEITTISVAGESRNYTDKLLSILYKNANQGDAIALSILRNVGEEYARAIASAVRDLPLLKGHVIDVVLAGKQFIHCKNDTAARTIDHWLQEHAAFEYRMHKMTTSPVCGAILWAMEKAGEQVSEEEKNRIRQMLRRFF